MQEVESRLEQRSRAMQEQLPKQAQIKADKRRKQAAKALKMTEEVGCN